MKSQTFASAHARRGEQSMKMQTWIILKCSLSEPVWHKHAGNGLSQEPPLKSPCEFKSTSPAFIPARTHAHTHTVCPKHVKHTCITAILSLQARSVRVYHAETNTEFRKSEKRWDRNSRENSTAAQPGGGGVAALFPRLKQAPSENFFKMYLQLRLKGSTNRRGPGQHKVLDYYSMVRWLSLYVSVVSPLINWFKCCCICWISYKGL